MGEALPEGANWIQLYGIILLCGIGFTVSLFIASLAFEHVGQEYIKPVRLSILTASFLSAVTGFLVLRFAKTSTLSSSSNTASTSHRSDAKALQG